MLVRGLPCKSIRKSVEYLLPSADLQREQETTEEIPCILKAVRQRLMNHQVKHTEVDAPLEMVFQILYSSIPLILGKLEG